MAYGSDHIESGGGNYPGNIDVVAHLTAGNLAEEDLNN